MDGEDIRSVTPALAWFGTGNWHLPARPAPVAGTCRIQQCELPLPFQDELQNFSTLP